MDGLGSLMQGAAPQGPQQGMPQQGMPMPMPPQNDPSMNAAMDLATDELDALNLDPRTKAALKTQEAYDLVQSAQRELVMAQEQPKPPTIEGQRTQQTLEGINALVQQLSPGIQQQGQQIAMAQRRSPMAQQGVSGMPARNMMRAAQGGIVGYAGPDGSQVKPTLGAMPQNVVSPDQIKQDAEIYQKLEAALAAATTPEDKAKVQMQLEALIRNMGNEHGKVMQYIDSTNGFTTPSSQMAGGGIVGYDGTAGSHVNRAESQRKAAGIVAAKRNEKKAALRNTPEWQRNKRIREILRETGTDIGGAVAQYEAELAAPLVAESNPAPLDIELLALMGEAFDTRVADEALVGGTSVPEGQTVGNVANISGLAGLLATAKARQNEPPFRMQGMEEATAPVRQQSPMEIALRARELENLGRDATGEGIVAGDRLRELTGLGALAGQRNTLQEEARRLREERFSPERMKKRTLRAGLAGLAERGLGGFGSGSTAERDKIDAERAAAAGISLAEVEKMITENRAMGMSQFEAENKARAEVDAIISQSGQTASEILATEQRREDAAADRASIERRNREQILSNEKVAATNAGRETDFGMEIAIRVDALMEGPEGEGMTLVQAKRRALGERVKEETEAALIRADISTETLDLQRLQAAYKMAADKLSNAVGLYGEEYNAAFQEEVDAIVAKFASSEGKTGPAVGTVKDGFRYKGGDPNVRSNWEKV